jgi:hypothetical protein
MSRWLPREAARVAVAITWAALAVPASIAQADVAGTPRIATSCEPLAPLRLDRTVFTLTQSRPFSGTSYLPDLDMGWRHSAGLEAALETGALLTHGPFRAHVQWRGAWGRELPARGRFGTAYLAWVSPRFDIRIGRASIHWAPATGADLLISMNARPLDHLRVCVRSGRAPWTRGVFDAETFLAYLDDRNREIADPLLWGMRAGWSAPAWLRIEMQRTILMGGWGRGERLTPRDIWNIFWAQGEGKSGEAPGPGYFSHRETDQKFAWQVSLRPPEPGRFGLHDFEVFYVYAGEDRLHALLPMAPGRSGAIRAHFTPALAASFEYASTAPRENMWYRHKVYTDGYTYRGVCLGHPMGTDAKCWQLRLAAAPAEGLIAVLSVMREWRGIHAIARGIEPGGHWQWELSLSAPGPRIGWSGTMPDPPASTRITATLGGATAWGSDLDAGRLTEGFARISIAWDPRACAPALNRSILWGDGEEAAPNGLAPRVGFP